MNNENQSELDYELEREKLRVNQGFLGKPLDSEFWSRRFAKKILGGLFDEDRWNAVRSKE